MPPLSGGFGTPRSVEGGTPKTISVIDATKHYLVTAPSEADETWRAYFPITPDL